MTPMHPQLSHLAGAYFHQDYRDEFADPDEVVRAFAEGVARDEVGALVKEIDELLASRTNEAELDQFWIMQLGANYDPRDDGLTYREWFAHVRRVLTDPA